MGAGGARYATAITSPAQGLQMEIHMRKVLLAFTAFSLAAVSPAATPAAPPTITAAVANPSRDGDNVKLDQSRKPAQVLSFLGLKRGMQVLDLFGSNRYWAEIIAPVVGPNGSETVWEPSQFYSDKAKAAFAPFAATHPNVKLIETPLQSPDFGKAKYDLAIFNLNYHDLYVDFSKRGIPEVQPRDWLKALYAAMKPGGIVGVIDHVANPGDTRATANALHRIDPATLKADFESVGFITVGTSDLLRNPADDHTLKVFDPKVRGETDRAIFRFRKPA
jgi:predicted methyltransferase